jgi:putative ABC transport system ATP-binding protein
MKILVVEGIRKTYSDGEMPVEAVRGVSFSLRAGDFAAVMGPSGCGKSTLLHLCGAMDCPTAGCIFFEGKPLSGFDDDRLTRLRRQRIGYVFQLFNLLPTLTVAENISLPLLLARVAPEESEARARALAERFDLLDRFRSFPQQLSGGEMQRVAVARAVIHRPALLIADEPTGNLDSENGRKVLRLIEELNRETGVAVLLATHDAEIAGAAHRIMHMKDGAIERVETALPDREGYPA